MSNKKDFGDRNKALCEQLYSGKTYFDWVVTTAFYSAIHLVEGAILPTDIRGITCNDIAEVRKAFNMNGRHEAREKLVFEKLNLEIGVRYKWLDDRSRFSRYTTYKIQDSEASKAIEYVNFIQKACFPTKE